MHHEAALKGTVDMMLGLDPTGPQAVALCVIAASALVLLLLAGFVLLAQYRHDSGKADPALRQDAIEVGLTALWRMDRQRRAERKLPAASRTHEPERPAVHA